MHESLAAVCGQFEQDLLAQLLRAADVGQRGGTRVIDSDDGDDRSSTSDGDDAFSQLMVQALSSAIERAGGIGLTRVLTHHLEREPRP